jgi:CubicO group peptidase (beta-lactamase class C family)
MRQRVALIGLALASMLLSACGGTVAPPPSPGTAAETRALSGPAEPLGPLLDAAAAVLPAPGAGVAVAVIDGDATSIGVAGNPRIGADTLFEYGSITKVLTANLLAQLAAEGVVALDDSVNAYLPGELQGEQWAPVTVGDLSSHSAGLPRLPPNLNAVSMVLRGDPADPYATYDVAQLYEGLADVRPDAPGRDAEYSNLGAGWLGTILSQATGLSYGELVQQRLFDPLGMTTATIDGWASDNIAPPLDDSGRPVSNWNFQALAGAGAARGSIQDAAAFLRASLAACEGEDAVARANCLAQQPTGHQLSADTEMGLGWLRTTAEGGTAVWHNGGTGGYRSFLGFNPATGRGVVLLSNVGGLDALDSIGLRYLLGME